MQPIETFCALLCDAKVSTQKMEPILLVKYGVSLVYGKSWG